MKTLFAFFTLLYLFALSGCSKSNDDTTPGPPADGPKKIFQLKIDSSFSTNQSDDWLLVHDVNGNLLGHKSFERGDLIILETTKNVPDNKLNITFFQYFAGAPNDHIFSTYLAIAVGQEWTLKANPGSPASHGNKIGGFSVSVSGVLEGSAYQLSNKTGMISGSTWGPGQLKLTADLYDSGPSWFLYVAGPTGNPKYKFYNNVINNSSFNESYTSLNNFDKNITVTFPSTKPSEIFYLVYGYEPGQSLNQNSYMINCSFLNSFFAKPNDLRSSLTLGFVDMFPNNKIVLDIRTTNYRYGYSRNGTAPDSITLPLTAVFTLLDKSFSTFQFQASQYFATRVSNWIYRDSSTLFRWKVYAPKESVQKMPELPAEFTTKYPQLLLNNLSHEETSFITLGAPYYDWIGANFEGKSIPNDLHESYSVSVH